MIKLAKPIKDEVCPEEYFWKKDVIAERESIARELEDIVKAHGGEPYRYTSYDEELLELAKELREAREIKEKDGSDMREERENKKLKERIDYLLLELKSSYFNSKEEALKNRKKGDRLYYNAIEEKYYLVTPIKRDFWLDKKRKKEAGKK